LYNADSPSQTTLMCERFCTHTIAKQTLSGISTSISFQLKLSYTKYVKTGAAHFEHEILLQATLYGE
jgi:hypothetical protein